MKIPVVQIHSAYVYDNFDDEWYCCHEGLEVIEPCCSGRDARWCGCGGEKEYYCPNPDCTGVEEDLPHCDARLNLVAACA